jgi:L-ascorbate metabolism protein UlaG (beta-lactamase superfamily)
VQLTYIGHATTLIEVGGARILTDPVLRDRVLHLERRAGAVDRSAIATLDLVLVSHLHHDHFDPSSLRMIDRRANLVVPRGAGHAASRLGFAEVIELGEGETFTIGGLEVTATHAEHGDGRWPRGRSKAIGFLIASDQRVYFAGDTNIFDGMRKLAKALDVALLPVWGWGPRLGPGHLDPAHAAEALSLLRPRVAVPIHWGTLYPIGLRRFRPHLMTEPPRAFARQAAKRTPAVDVRILNPGETTKLARRAG